MTAPASLRHWATTGTRTAPSSGLQDSGYVAGDVPGAENLNDILGNAFDWLAWLKSKLVDTQTLVLGPSAIQNFGEIDIAGSDTSSSRWVDASGAPRHFTVSLGGFLPVGSRLLEARVILSSSHATAADASAILRKLAAPVGGSPTQTDLTTLTDSTATAAIQAITLTPASPETLAADTDYEVFVEFAGTAGTRIFYRIEIDFDFNG